jgi:hypothetical protein
MTRWTSKFWPRIELDVPDDWSVEEYENCASFTPTDGSWVTVDVNPQRWAGVDSNHRATDYEWPFTSDIWL